MELYFVIFAPCVKVVGMILDVKLIHISTEKLRSGNMTKLRKFLCNILGWHKPSDCIDIHGANVTSKCKYCGKYIILDSQGNWF